MESNRTNLEKVKTIKDLFSVFPSISIPAYQRAYAWEKKNIEDFFNDVQEYANKGKQYYLGNFLVEKTTDNDVVKYEIIDGQQRLTSIVLFISACNLLQSESGSSINITKFNTVEYDKEIFQKIISGETLSEFDTVSGKKMYDNFQFLFKNLKKNVEIIADSVKIIENASCTYQPIVGKAMSTAVFEFQNARGIQTTEFERIKAYLMNRLFIESFEESEENVKKMEGCFKSIFTNETHLLKKQKDSEEDKIGTISLEDLLLYHTRVIGTFSNDDFDTPSTLVGIKKALYPESGFKGESLLLSERILKFAENYKETCIFCAELLRKVEQQPMLENCLFLDKSRTYSFLIKCFHSGITTESILSSEFTSILKLWEILLFTFDYHDKLYKKWYKENFYGFLRNSDSFLSSVKLKEKLKELCTKGFRSHDFNLSQEFRVYINNGSPTYYNYGQGRKTNYWLACYTMKKSNNRLLYKIKPESIEHIFPQSPEQDYSEELRKRIQDIGNWVPLSKSENSVNSNKKPSDKFFPPTIDEKFNDWDEENAIENIDNRSKKLIAFALEYFNVENA